MTGPEHYREAEQAIAASTYQRQEWGDVDNGSDVQEAAMRAADWASGFACWPAMNFWLLPRAVASPEQTVESAADDSVFALCEGAAVAVWPVCVPFAAWEP